MTRPSQQPHDPRRAYSRPSDREEHPDLDALGCAWLCIGFLLLAIFVVVALLLQTFGLLDALPIS